MLAPHLQVRPPMGRFSNRILKWLTDIEAKVKDLCEMDAKKPSGTALQMRDIQALASGKHVQLSSVLCALNGIGIEDPIDRARAVNMWHAMYIEQGKADRARLLKPLPESLGQTLRTEALAIPQKIHPQWTRLMEPAFLKDLQCLDGDGIYERPFDLVDIVGETYRRVTRLPPEDVADLTPQALGDRAIVNIAVNEAVGYLRTQGVCENPDTLGEDIRRQIYVNVVQGKGTVFEIIQDIMKRMNRVPSSTGADTRTPRVLKTKSGRVKRKGVGPSI